MKQIERIRISREEQEQDFREVTSQQNGRYAHELDAVFVGGALNGQHIPHIQLMHMENKGYTPRWSAMKVHNPNLINLDLEDQPIIEGYLSPMLDGECLRYESQEAYDTLTAPEQEERAQEAAELIDEIVKLEYELNNKKAELAGLLAVE